MLIGQHIFRIKNNTIWAATLNVANAADGRKILYDVGPIKKVGRAVKSAQIPTTQRIPQPQTTVNRSSLSDSDVLHAGRGWDVYGRDIVAGQAQGVPELRTNGSVSDVQWNTGLDVYSEEMEDAILDGGNRVIKNRQNIVDMVRDAFTNVREKSRAYFGNLSAGKLEQLEAQVENLPPEMRGKLFKKGKSYSVTATLDSIRHIMDDKAGMTQEDVVEYLAKMPQIISEPDRVTFTYYTDSKGQKEKALRFEKAFPDGKMISVDVVSNKKRSLTLQSLFMERTDYGNKKRAAKTLPSVNGGVTAESGGAGQPFVNRNIAEGKRTVNPNSVDDSTVNAGVPELEHTEPAPQASEPVPELKTTANMDKAMAITGKSARTKLTKHVEAFFDKWTVEAQRADFAAMQAAMEAEAIAMPSTAARMAA